ncbi:3-hydroxybutyryl-CoA dehydrogenase [Lentilactobacillus parabuchneri]|nr:3-hydroxybutyryl-CoA dehydrogenase [Lentilactobacillus parabuchneri]
MIVKKVVILGGGVLGSQIAYQSAFSGIKTVIYDISDEAVQQAQQKIDSYPQQYKQRMPTSLLRRFRKGLILKSRPIRALRHILQIRRSY